MRQQLLITAIQRLCEDAGGLSKMGLRSIALQWLVQNNFVNYIYDFLVLRKAHFEKCPNITPEEVDQFLENLDKMVKSLRSESVFLALGIRETKKEAKDLYRELGSAYGKTPSEVYNALVREIFFYYSDFLPLYEARVKYMATELKNMADNAFDSTPPCPINNIRNRLRLRFH